MLTSEEVILAYRLYLGREPENADVVNNLCQTVHTISELRAAFMESPEFRKLMGEELDKQQQIRHRHPFTSPHIPVESEVSDEVLSKMFDRIHEEWSNLGVSEPYWSVITQPQFYRADFDEKNKVLKSRPLHNFASHAEDSMRYMAQGLTARAKHVPIKYPSTAGII